MQFNNSKSKLIHFKKTRNHLKDSIILSNNTQIQFKFYVKWLSIWLDKKLGFKKHIETKVNNTTNALYIISSLFKSKWRLSINIIRQLYLIYVLSIAKYNLEI